MLWQDQYRHIPDGGVFKALTDLSMTETETVKDEAGILGVGGALGATRKSSEDMFVGRGVIEMFWYSEMRRRCTTAKKLTLATRSEAETLI